MDRSIGRCIDKKIDATKLVIRQGNILMRPPNADNEATSFNLDFAPHEHFVNMLFLNTFKRKGAFRNSAVCSFSSNLQFFGAHNMLKR